MELKQEVTAKRIPELFGSGALLFSLLWLTFLTFCYFTWLPTFALITVLPPWLWSVPGILLIPIALRLRRWRSGAVTVLFWCVFILSFCEEPWALLTLHKSWTHTASQGQKAEAGHFRLISINCSNGQLAAAKEALALEPDILIMEESPSKADLIKLEELSPGTSTVYGMDVSVLARGKIESLDSDKDWKRNAVGIHLNDLEILLVGVRLNPPHFSLAPWDPGEWAKAAKSQTSQSEDMQNILKHVEEYRNGKALIIAGDFNTPARSPVLSGLNELDLADSFVKAGIGLGNTILNSLPVARIDQVWMSKEFAPQSVLSLKTEHSDHRMVICDFTINNTEPMGQ